MILIKNAKAIILQDEIVENQNILIDDNEIRYIGPEEYPAREVIDASDMVVYPGLINTHHHLYQTFTRNIPAVQNMELFPWLKYLYELWKYLEDDTIYYSSLTGMIELVKYGCTTIFDHHYVFRSDMESEFIDTQFKAAEDLGVRFHASRGSMSLGVDDGGLPPMSVVQTDEEILADSRRIIEKYHDTSKCSMRQVVLAPCSPFSVTAELMKKSAALAREYGVKLHTHLAETIDEENFCIKKMGMRPLAYMESVDWVGEDVFFAHGIHFNDEEMDLLAKTKSGVAHCPLSNMKLSSGIARISEMVEREIPVGLAVDGSASNDGSNMLAELRAAFLLQRLRYSNDAIDPKGIFKVATEGSANILGRKDIGYLAPGMAADMFMININRINYVGTEEDYLGLLTTVGVSHPVDYTIINGKVVVRDGELTTLNEQAIIEKARAAYKKFRRDL